LILTDLYRSVQLLVFCSLAFSISLHAQKDDLQKGNAAFEEDHFREALIYYNRIEKINSSAPILFKRGVCHFEINQLDNALEDFRRAWEFGYKDPDIDFYTGKIHHHRGQFAIAAKHYKDFLKEADDEDIRRPNAIKLIKQCGRAIDLSYLSPLGILEQLPGGLNTAYDEIGLIESPSVEDKYYFTSNQPNTTTTLHASDYDVYWTQLTSGKWSEPKRMSYLLNRSDQDILLGFTTQADGIYFYRGKDFQGDVLLSKGVNTKSKPKNTEIPTTLSIVNNDAYFYNDEVVIFSSREGQGYGGYDLYASVKRDGYWTTPVNLGSHINSSFDEVSPYLSEDGSELYFSSDRDESIGGLDIFFSPYLYEANRWATPVNLGIPINSPGDDAYFQLSFDGLTAMMSSDRKNALGGMDMYLVRFKERRASFGYGDGHLAFLEYEIPEVDTSQKSGESFEDLVSIDSSAIIDESHASANETKEPVKPAETSTIVLPEPTEVVAEEPAEKAPEKVAPTTTEPETVSTSTETPADRVEEEVKVEKPEQPVVSTPPIQSDEKNQPARTVPVESTSIPVTTVEVERTPSQPVVEEAPEVEPAVNFTYQPIYYTSGQDLVTEDNYDNLNKIIEVLQANDQLHVDLVGHSAAEGIIEYKLFSSLKIAERLQRHFVDEYTPEIAKLTKYNSRVEIYFSKYDEGSSVLERKGPELPPYAQDSRFELYNTILENSITYKVSIAVVGQMYRNKALDLFNDTSVEEDKTTGLYTYSIGLYDSFAEAITVKRDMDRLGLTDARVIAYYNGKRLTEEDYVYYVNEFPDLRGLMNSSE